MGLNEKRLTKCQPGLRDRICIENTSSELNSKVIQRRMRGEERLNGQMCDVNLLHPAVVAFISANHRVVKPSHWAANAIMGSKARVDHAYATGNAPSNNRGYPLFPLYPADSNPQCIAAVKFFKKTLSISRLSIPYRQWRTCIWNSSELPRMSLECVSSSSRVILLSWGRWRSTRLTQPDRPVVQDTHWTTQCPGTAALLNNIYPGIFKMLLTFSYRLNPWPWEALELSLR